MQLHNLVAALTAETANESLRHNATTSHEALNAVERCSSGATLRSLIELLARSRGSSFVADAEPCQLEAARFLLLFFGLAFALASVAFALCNIREDKVESIPPLCPGLVVKEPVLLFRMPLDTPDSDKLEVYDAHGRVLCKVIMHWADPFLQKESQSLVATATVQDSCDTTLAVVVARSSGEGLYAAPSLSIRRAFQDTFARVDVEGPRLMHVAHWMNMHMLTLIGEFSPMETDIEGINAEGTKVFSMRRKGDECVGKVLQSVDAGLVICSVLAARIHRRLMSPPQPLLEEPQEVESTGVIEEGDHLEQAAAADGDEEPASFSAGHAEGPQTDRTFQADAVAGGSTAALPSTF